MTARVLMLVPLCIASALHAQEDQTAAEGRPPGAAGGETEPAKEHAFSWHLRLVDELVGDLSGGRRQGFAGDVLIIPRATVDSAGLGLWPGGRLRVAALGLASSNPSVELIGDVQGASNIAGPSQLRLHRLYYRQRISSLTMRAGVMSLNDYFVVTQSAGTLLNSSFGIAPTLGINVPAAIYPTPGLGLMMAEKWSALTARAGIFQGNPDELGSAFHAGYMAIAELRGTWADDGTGGGATLGGWYRRAPVIDDFPSRAGGTYLLAEQKLRGGRTALFAQLATSPAAGTQVSYYAGIGLDVSQPLGERPRDHLAAGVASAWLRRTDHPAEVSLEATYQLALRRGLDLQPDLQLVISPGGTYPTALVGMLRLELSIDGASESGRSRAPPSAPPAALARGIVR